MGKTASQKGMGSFLWWNLTPRRARLDEMVKNGAWKSLNLKQSFLHYIFFGENFIGQVKVTLYSVYLNLNHEKTE